MAESLQKGNRVIVSGRLKQRSYENRNGERRTVYEVDVDEIGPALRYATAQVTRTSGGGWSQSRPSQGDGGGYRGGGGGGGSQSRSDTADPWAQAQSDEPPF